MNAAEPLFEVRGLVKDFAVRGRTLWGRDTRTLRAVNEVSFKLVAGETLALVGESGCGKTTLARIAALMIAPEAGSVLVEGRQVSGLGRRDLKSLRRRIQLVFQDPYASLNPRLTVGAIIGEPLVIHGIGDAAERRRRVAEVAEAVGLAEADLGGYPHQFSGGQRQRVAIARALVSEPSLIIADEPVSALDVSIRGQILNLFRDLQRDRNLTYLFISHDLSVVRHIADRVAVMYLGRIVETGPAAEIFDNPRHPYTRALLDAAPAIGRGKRRLGDVLEGEVPSALDAVEGCPFNPRCWITRAACFHTRPRLERAIGEAGHFAACHLKDEGRL